MGWANTEFETIDLGDARRNKRAIRLVERLSAQPTASVPQACGDWAETMAAYRFFDNEEVDWRTILGAHTDCARTRMAGHEVVLCIQDTTELDFNGQEASGQRPGAAELRSAARHVRAPNLRRVDFARTAGRARRVDVGTRTQGQGRQPSRYQGERALG